MQSELGAGSRSASRSRSAHAEARRGARRRRSIRPPRAPGDGTVVVIDDEPLDLALVEAVLAPESFT